ncbi:hypothetical protein HPG69_002870, partial [Diceros bicornis minor]
MGHSPGLHLPGYLLILVVFVFPFWVWLVNEESHEVFFSGLFENCLAIKCWKPRHLSIVLSFLTTFSMWSFVAQLFPRTQKHNFVGLCFPGLVAACPGDPESEGAICLFQASACLGCHLLSISQSIEETEGILHLVNLESLGGYLHSIQKDTLL